MGKQAIVFEAERTGYNIDQIAGGAMTVGELKSLLEDYDDDTLFVLSHDRGYTFGSINSRKCSLWEEGDEDGEWVDTENI